jgi:NhaP-type Na+/H+ or K+/H+ antiporter
VKQEGISPKVVAAAVTGLAVYLITKLGLQVDPVIEQAINVAAMLVAAYLAPPGNVQVDAIPEGSVPPPARRGQHRSP